jgi:hypothetical protein
MSISVATFLQISAAGTLAFVPADGSARYLHIGKAGLGAPSDSRFITGLCYVFSESAMTLDSVKWDAPYPASDFAINHRELDKSSITTAISSTSATLMVVR